MYKKQGKGLVNIPFDIITKAKWLSIERSKFQLVGTGPVQCLELSK